MNDYIHITLDVFDHQKQRLKILRSITIQNLMDAVLKEFDDLDKSQYQKYALFLCGQDKPLPTHLSLHELDIHDHDELEFGYRKGSSPAGLTPMTKVFLQETNSKQLFELCWQPAIVGRSSTSNMHHNQLLAVDLKHLPFGAKVSRRHLQISEKDHIHYLSNLSTNNPVQLNQQRLEKSNHPLKNGDLITFCAAGIHLQFIHQQSDSKPTPQVSVPQANLTTIASPLPQQVSRRVEITHLPFTMGRKNCSFNLEGDPSISRNHASIHYNSIKQQFLIVDLGSTNGVQVNQHMLVVGEPFVLSSGDQIKFSKQTILQFSQKD